MSVCLFVCMSVCLSVCLSDCLKLKISVTTEPIGDIPTGPGMGLSYFLGGRDTSNLHKIWKIPLKKIYFFF